MNRRARATRAAALAAWAALVLSVVLWLLPRAGIGLGATLVACLPLLLPLPGIARGAHRVLGAAPMALAPALALAITEYLANPPARPFAGATLGLVCLAFAAVLAALRARPRD